jgi:gas vesicle protein
MANNNNEGSYSKGLAVGLILGGVVGGAIALLLAPKTGKELRRDLAERSGDIYIRASDFATEQSQRIGDRVGDYVNEGKVRADELVRTARQQAGSLMNEAEHLMSDARSRISTTQSGIKDNVSRIQDAANAGAEAFQREMARANHGDSELL